MLYLQAVVFKKLKESKEEILFINLKWLKLIYAEDCRDSEVYELWNIFDHWL